MDKLLIIKIGGNIIDHEESLASFLGAFARLPGKKILVHGGGKLATDLATRLNVPQEMVEGRRITDAATLKIVTMVYAGYINKNIVALLQANQCNAIGITGADANLLPASKRVHPTIDYGFAGDILHAKIPVSRWQEFLDNGLSPVVAPITHDGAGQLLNTNADTMAQEIAVALARKYQVKLIFSFEKAGVLLDVDNEDSVIPKVDSGKYSELRMQEKISGGMIPKLDNAFRASEQGVEEVIIGKAEDLEQILSGKKGTRICR